jgi:thioredoxin 1
LVVGHHMKNLFQDIDYNSFGEFLNNSLVLVDFWANWCYPCKQQHEILQKLAIEFDGQMKFASLNVDDNRVIASKQNVRNIPTLIFYENGNETRRIIGLQSEGILRDNINSEINNRKIA